MAAPQHDAPKGMDKYDYFALNQEQQAKLNEHKIKTRLENERYLRDHPELDCLLKLLINQVLTERPDNVHEFCAEFFGAPDLVDRVTSRLREVTREKTHVAELVAASQQLPPEDLVYNEK